ncbi:extracellular solute-binding protein [Paenibacillus alvei]|uniref:Extracellular solute-binding protein n=1 Tax=Paenibacillus alvei TaxID=44250 RepID=A0ABT4GXD9_PAEAL|nr:extracellular solute-binding protein [Paenibacillus alvei]MCY9761378.1 extracellular solute-binding protein [Paenibacillus alvei]MCY9765576.1 extracellular solute-binding protein [Paenibacillus alvei]
MKRKGLSFHKIKMLSFLILFLFAASGCDEQPSIMHQVQADDEHIAEAKPPLSITVWCFEEQYADYAKKFEAAHPGVTVNVKRFSYKNHAEAYLDALEQGYAPDVMEVGHEFLGEFNGIQGLVDLNAPPFQASELKPDISPDLWDTGLSYDNKHLIALPITTSPLVTFYRKDILERYGFPSEPEKLALYMEDPDRWLAMAKRLKEHGIYLLQWDREPLQWYESMFPLLNSRLQFNRNNAMIAQGMLLSQRVNVQGLDANVGVWTEAGTEALGTGKLAMVYLGSWGEQQLEEWAPHTKGLWRATRLPMKLYGYYTGSSLIMPEQARNKELAWSFMKSVFYGVTDDSTVAAYLPSRKVLLDQERHSQFLGGQQADRLYMELASKMKEFRPTPLDKQAAEWYHSVKQRGIENNTLPDVILNQIEKLIEQGLQQERRVILQYSRALFKTMDITS